MKRKPEEFEEIDDADDAADEEIVVGGITVNKAALAEVIFERHGIDRHDGKQFVDRFFALIIEHLKQGHVVKLPGLGNFSVRDKNERPGRNLKTGETVLLNERRVVNFHPSGTLNSRVTDSLIKAKTE